MEINWTTPKGTAINLELITGKEINADGDKITVKTFELHATAGSCLMIAPRIKNHPKVGPCLNDGRNNWMPIVHNVLTDVTAIVDRYWAEVERREAIADKNAAEYEAHYNHIHRTMAE
jgi:hypothetical protein